MRALCVFGWMIPMQTVLGLRGEPRLAHIRCSGLYLFPWSPSGNDSEALPAEDVTMKPSATTPVYLAVLGVSLLASGILFHRYPLFDAIANLGFPYLAGMLGFAALVVGLHCVLFGSGPAELPLRANVALYVLIAGAANVNIIWDGVAGGFSHGDIWLNLANSVEFSLYYAAFLFLPRWMGKASPGSSAKDQSDRSVFLELLRAVFPKIVAMIYTAGTVVHILRLIFRFHVTDIPFEVDWVIVVLGPVGVVGLIVFSKHYRLPWPLGAYHALADHHPPLHFIGRACVDSRGSKSPGSVHLRLQLQLFCDSIFCILRLAFVDDSLQIPRMRVAESAVVSAIRLDASR